ncbi:MAG: Na+/H+ antiporter NhaC [Verrucomicrobiota bacterium]
MDSLDVLQEPAAGKTPGLAWALFPVIFLIASLSYTIIILEDDPRIPIILGSVAAALIGWKHGYSWGEMQAGIVRGISVVVPAILILMLIGIMIGLWIAGGVVPLMIHTGLQVLSPTGFLPAACVLCSVVSLATGSSWTTAGSVGIALIGVGNGLGISPAMSAGAIISGAYFGDKMSPLSDSTNLAPGVVGVELIDHIKHMIFTTGPSFLMALVGFWFLGMSVSGGEPELGEIPVILSTLEAQFSLNPSLWTAPILVFGMVAARVPAIPALFCGGIVGACFSFVIEGHNLASILSYAQGGFVSESGLSSLDDLLSKGGLDSMMWTISLILCASTFGGLMESTGQLRAIGQSILKVAKSRGSLISSTAFTAVGTNFMAADQYLAIILPGRMFREAYERKGLHAVNLSRVLEDTGTLSSPLVAWNTCGATMTAALGVATGDYWMFCLFNLINPIVSILYGFTGWTLRKA